MVQSSLSPEAEAARAAAFAARRELPRLDPFARRLLVEQLNREGRMAAGRATKVVRGGA